MLLDDLRLHELQVEGGKFMGDDTRVDEVQLATDEPFGSRESVLFDCEVLGQLLN
jgi:hypothetical protein